MISNIFFFESKFGLNSLIRYDKHIGTRQLIRYWVVKIKHMINNTVTMVIMIILISLYDLVCWQMSTMRINDKIWKKDRYFQIKSVCNQMSTLCSVGLNYSVAYQIWITSYSSVCQTGHRITKKILRKAGSICRYKNIPKMNTFHT